MIDPPMRGVRLTPDPSCRFETSLAGRDSNPNFQGQNLASCH